MTTTNDPTWRPWFGTPNLPDAAFAKGSDEQVVRAFFPDVRPTLKPELRLVMGPVASGKSRYREEQCYAFVASDPVEIYTALTDDGKSIPQNIGELVAGLGEEVIALAVRERRSLVVELVPTDEVVKQIDDLIRAAKSRRYTITMAKFEVTNEEAQRRHAGRSPKNVSCLETQGDAIAWLMKAFFPGMARR
jgi:hypothetical protein